MSARILSFPASRDSPQAASMGAAFDISTQPPVTKDHHSDARRRWRRGPGQSGWVA